jgi:hypothetical protein
VFAAIVAPPALPRSSFSASCCIRLLRNACSSNGTPAALASLRALINVIGDFSNIPYNFVNYGTVNDVGRQWIRKYFLALCKELLGSIRQKYQTIPIPGGEVTLDGGELRNEATQEKDNLITQIRETLEASSRRQQMENRSQESEYLQDQLRRIPTLIYIG